MSLTDLQIRCAVAEALDFAIGTTPSVPVAKGDVVAGNFLADYPDSARIVGIEPVPIGGNEVLVGSLQELTLAVRALGIMIETPITAAQMRSHLEHEAAHGQAAKAVGFMGLNYGLSIKVSTPSGRPTWNLFHAYHSPVEPPTKLALASVTAAPLEPSQADKAKVQQFGYESVQEVAKRIEAYNARGNGRPLPLPLSSLVVASQLAG